MPRVALADELAEVRWAEGMRQHNGLVRALAQREGYDLVDAEEVFGQRPELAREFLDGVHLTPAGNAVKAELLAELLAAAADTPSATGAGSLDDDAR
jgi:lysophospholipase L1-like esterase